MTTNALRAAAVKTCIGLTFKERFGVHKKGFIDPTYCQTTLSNYIEPKVTWKIIDKGKSYSPVSSVCQLCKKEANCIIFEPDTRHGRAEQHRLLSV